MLEISQLRAWYYMLANENKHQFLLNSIVPTALCQGVELLQMLNFFKAN